MISWSKDELRKIAEADDLHISPFREGGLASLFLFEAAIFLPAKSKPSRKRCDRG